MENPCIWWSLFSGREARYTFLYGHHHEIPKEWKFWVMERVVVVVVVVVEDGLVEMVGEWYPCS